MSRVGWRFPIVRWGWRVSVAGLSCLAAVAALPGVAFAAFPLEVNVPMNTRDNETWSFNLTVPRWNIVFMHPYSAGDEDLSVALLHGSVRHAGAGCVDRLPADGLGLLASRIR